jgi:hypothetical protein
MDAYSSVPQFTIHDVDAREIRYREIWQHDHLVLVLLDTDAPRATIDDWLARRQAFADLGARLIISRDAIPGVAPPALIVADRWGEIVYRWTGPMPQAQGMPGPDEALEWIDWVARRCPECEGEAR